MFFSYNNGDMYFKSYQGVIIKWYFMGVAHLLLVLSWLC